MFKRFGLTEFTDAEAAVGVSFARSRHGFSIDKNFLRAQANLTLKVKEKDATISFPEILSQILPSIQFNERAAYASGIGKMWSERNSAQRRHQVAV